MNPRSDLARPSRRRPGSIRRAWPVALPLVLLLASCTSVVAGTPQTAAGAVVERPLSARERTDLADAVVSAHTALSAMTRTAVHRDPVSTDDFRVAEKRVGDRVDRVVTFTPTSVELWSIEEIRCVDRRAYASPPPEGLEVATPWVEVPIDPDVDGSEAAEEAGAGDFIAYYCDYGFAEDLAYDVTFLDEARRVVDLGVDTVDGDQVERYRVELDERDAVATVVGLVWLNDDTLFEQVADTVTVEITVDERDRIRTLDSVVVADDVEYGDSLAFAGFDDDSDITAPDPADVTTP